MERNAFETIVTADDLLKEGTFADVIDYVSEFTDLVFPENGVTDWTPYQSPRARVARHISTAKVADGGHAFAYVQYAAEAPRIEVGVTDSEGTVSRLGFAEADCEDRAWQTAREAVQALDLIFLMGSKPAIVDYARCLSFFLQGSSQPDSETFTLTRCEGTVTVDADQSGRRLFAFLHDDQDDLMTSDAECISNDWETVLQIFGAEYTLVPPRVPYLQIVG